jgi:four helix bundle protein
MKLQAPTRMKHQAPKEMKLQAPSSKLQRSSKREAALPKLQAPESKLQRSSKSQAPSRAMRARYPEVEASTSRLQETPSDNGRHSFDLEERTSLFGEMIVRFAKTIPRGPGNDRLINQLVGCGTSVGANYCEANERVSKKDFRNTIARCVKEAKETKYFLRLIAAAEPKLAANARGLYREAKELHLIFASMFRQ